MTDATKRTGGCLCGKVRYEVPREMKTAAKCHCLNCQKSTGASAMTAAAYADEDVKVTGETRSYTYTSDGGRPVTNNFCPNCGSSVTMITPALAGLTLIRAGTLDALAVTSANRTANLPGTPTFRELGHKDFVSVTWFSLSGPPNNPNCDGSRMGSARPRCLNACEVNSRPRGVRCR